MKLSYITIMVRDLEQSLRFYQELADLRIIRQMEPLWEKSSFWQTKRERLCWS